MDRIGVSDVLRGKRAVSDCRPTAWGYQLQSGDPNGGVNCAAYALADGLDFDSCGEIQTTGARIRALSDEPVPNPKSPGLHHGQLRDVAAKFGVRLTLLNGAPWDEVDDAQRSGHGVLLAVNYVPIRPTIFSGQRSFYGNHELLVLPGWFTFDPLADGRMSNGQRVFKGPAVYPESLLMQAAGAFRLKSGKPLGFGRAVAAVLPHRHPLAGVPAPPPTVPPAYYSTKEGNVAILAAYAGHTYRMSKGQKLYRAPSGTHVTTLAAAGSVEYIGKAGQGWVALKVGTAALYADGIVRPTVLYAPAGSGVLE